MLTKEEMERRVRLILEPWDGRGILEVEGCNLSTMDSEEDPSDSEQQNSDDSIDGDDTQSFDDEIVHTSNQKDEDGDGIA